MKYPLHLLKLIDTLKKLPGVGSKTAERYAFELVNWPTKNLNEMATLIDATPTQLKICDVCGCLIDLETCQFCDAAKYGAQTMCVVAMPRDVFSIAATNEYKGLYHVLGALLSPIDGIGPESLNLNKLVKRVIDNEIKEVVIALDSTLEGDTTSLYIKQALTPLNIQISRLAFGLPMGSSIDYVDGGTLARALSARSCF